jgi:hypothetical protein
MVTRTAPKSKASSLVLDRLPAGGDPAVFVLVRAVTANSVGRLGSSPSSDSPSKSEASLCHAITAVRLTLRQPDYYKIL